MRFAVLSDIHSNLEALETVLEDIEHREIDGYLCIGDLVGYYFRPNEVVEILRSLGALCVRGNHDEFAVRDDPPLGMNSQAAQAIQWNKDRLSEGNLSFLRHLPLRREEPFTGKRVFMAHGSPVAPLDEYIEPRQADEHFLDRCFHNEWPDVLIMGHTHVPFAKKIGHTLVMNPGSVGQPRDGDPKASYAILSTEEPKAEIVRVEYNVEEVVKEVKKEGLPDMLGKRLRKGK